MSSPIIAGYYMSQIEEDILKLPDNPSMPEKWAIIQRLFILMMRIYNMGKNRED